MVSRNRCISSFVVLFVTFLLLTASNIAAALDAKDFDFNRNNSIDPGEEAIAFFRHFASSVYRDFDRNKDGIIQLTEEKEHLREIEEDVEDLLDEYNLKRGTRDAVPVTEINRSYGQLASKPNSLGGFLIREKHEDVTVLNYPSQFRRAKGATLSFSRNIGENENMWTLRGAILRPFRKSTDRAPNSSKMVLTSYSFSPSLSFDRVKHSKNHENDIDSLVFRLGLEIEYGGGGLFQLQYFRINLGYATDFDFGGSVPVGEIQWEPVKSGWGIGTSREFLCGLLEYRFRGILHAEAGTILKADEKSTMEEDDEFMRLGPKVELVFWPTAELLHRVSLSLKMRYLWGLTGNPTTGKLWEAGLNYRLDDKGHVQLQAEYRNGHVGFTEGESETFLVGVGIKF